MAHELTIRENGFAETAFVGSTPWHELGQQLPQNADMETWRKAAGMDWTLESSPVQFNKDQIFSGKNVLYRSDTLQPMSIVSNRYKAVQPWQVLDFFKEMIETAGFKLHTAGTLFGGKRLWALAETGKFAEVTKGDGVGGYLLLSTSCDRTLSTTARFTTVRVVCNNTLEMAVNRNENIVSITHAAEFNPAIMKDKLALAVESFGSFMEMAKFLQKINVSNIQAKKYLNEILNLQDVDKWIAGEEFANKEQQKSRAFEKIMDLFKGDAKGIEITGNTGWGLINAVTEYYDHHLPARTTDARLNGTWFGTGNEIKNKAVKILLNA